MILLLKIVLIIKKKKIYILKIIKTQNMPLKLKKTLNL